MSIQGTAAAYAKNLMKAGRSVSKQAAKLEANGLNQEAKVLTQWSENVAGKQGIASGLRKGTLDQDAATKMVKLASDSFEFKSSIRAAKAPSDSIWMTVETSTGRVRVARESFAAAAYQSEMADRLLKGH